MLPENGRPRYLDPADGFALRQYFDRYADGYADTTIDAVEAQQGRETIATGHAQVVSAADVERAAFGDWTDDSW